MPIADPRAEPSSSCWHTGAEKRMFATARATRVKAVETCMDIVLQNLQGCRAYRVALNSGKKVTIAVRN